MLWFVLFIIAGLIVIALGSYAGALLFKLKMQHKALVQQKLLKVTTLSDSIRIIASAMQSGQCELSEGVIRIVKLLQAMPDSEQASSKQYSNDYPTMHQLFIKIEHMPTHEARQQQTSSDRQKMDSERSAYENELRAEIMLEVQNLMNFSC